MKNWSASTRAPDWLESGGRSPRFPDETYVTGFGVGQGAEALESAKQQAAASLAQRLEVRIEHELRDVSEDRDGETSYHVAALTRTTVDLRLTGLEYETHARNDGVFALAILERVSAAGRRRDRRDLAAEALNDCLASGERHGPARAVAIYEGCRRSLALALEHAAVVRVLAGVTDADRQVHRDLVRASLEVDDRIEAVVRRPVDSLASAAESLAVQLGRQGVTRDDRLFIYALTYGTADVSSGFGQQLSNDLEAAIARVTRESRQTEIRDLTLTGVYVERGDEVRVDVTARNETTGQLVASAGVSLPGTAVPPGLEVKPEGFESVVAVQELLSDGGVITGDLQVDLWTSRGRKGIVLSEGDEYRLYYRVNRPAWLRLIYVLQNGEQVPIDEAFFVDASNVNVDVEHPDRFEVVAPFGVEHIYAVAFSEEPPRLAYRPQWIDGVRYDVVVDGAAAIRRARGMRIRRNQGVAEAFVAVTTAPKPQTSGFSNPERSRQEPDLGGGRWR